MFTEKDGELAVRIARSVIEKKLGKADAEIPQGTSSFLNKSGVFVTLKKNNQLRGCIGSTVGALPLVYSVIDNTRNSATRDPRFPPVKADETGELSIEISVLTPLEPLTDYQNIRLGVDGVMLSKGTYSGLFLPQVATETGWELEEFMDNLCIKAGLEPGAHKDPETKLYHFQVQKFSELDFQERVNVQPAQESNPTERND